MLNALVIIAVIGLFICYEFLMSLSLMLAPAQAFAIKERYATAAIRHIVGLTRRYCRVSLDFQNSSGSRLPERFILVSNHQSLMDIPIFMALFSVRMLRFVAKRELGFGVPFVSFILRSQGHALIRRKGDATQSMRSIRRFARRCEEDKTCPVIFPEGHRTRNGTVGAFHTAGVRKILAETPLPMVVAVMDGGWRVAKLTDLVKNLREARFSVHVLSVTPTLFEKKDILEALAKAREDIVAELAAMRGYPRA
jgi:1-acyl-sn-glycerol-3-phosphate acyltransferase